MDVSGRRMGTRAWATRRPDCCGHMRARRSSAMILLRGPRCARRSLRRTRACNDGNGRDTRRATRVARAMLLLLAASALCDAGGPARPRLPRRGAAGDQRPAHDSIRPDSRKDASGCSRTRPAIDEQRRIGHRSCCADPSARRRACSSSRSVLAGARNPRHGGPRESRQRRRRAERTVRSFAVHERRRSRRPTARCAKLDVLVFDLQDIGTRTWTYVGAMIYSMRAAARTRHADHRARPAEPAQRRARRRADARPALANPEDPTPRGRAGVRAVSRAAAPRHDDGRDGALLQRGAEHRRTCTSCRCSGWRRAMWFDETACRGYGRRPTCRRSRARCCIPRSSRSRRRTSASGAERRRLPAVRRAVAQRRQRRSRC